MAAGQSPRTASTPPAKRASAVRIANGAIDLDGELGEPAWSTVAPITDFVQKDPVEGAVPEDHMEIRFLYDDEALFVAVRVFSKDPAHIQAPMSRRDNITQAEHLIVSLDTYHDRRTAYSFAVTASGVRGDWYHPRDDEYDIDQSFDPVWQAESQQDSLGWTAEMRIPFSQLRFNTADSQVWGMNIDHWIPARKENVFWIPVPRKEEGWASHFGLLEGLSGIKPSRRLELMPYVASEASVNGDRDRANPFDDGRNFTHRAGGDVKMGVGPGLTLEGTVNPDFGQVEADPAEVNLSAFETFFDERRPFFIENAQLLRGQGGEYFYSRRIGATPRGPASGDYVDYPGASTIVGAAKLTGQLENGLSVGALTAVTKREYAQTYDTTLNQRQQVLVAPPIAYGVARVQKTFGASASTAGLSLTGVERALSGDDVLSTLLIRRAYTGGADMDLRFHRGYYSLEGYAGFSYVEGDTLAILGLQRSSARYFQRPDARSYHLDPSRRNLSGYTAGLEFSKNSGKHWLYSIRAGAESPALELNDIGRTSTADGLASSGGIEYRETQPGRLFRNYAVSLEQEREWNYDRDSQYNMIDLDANTTLRNFWELDLSASRAFRAQDQRLTRGGPTMGTPELTVGIISLSNSFASKTRWNASVYYGKDEYGSPTNRLSGSLSIRPGSNLAFSIVPDYLRSIDSRQYIATVDDGRPETFGKHYVFSFIDRSTFLTQLRMTYTMTPDLTLDLYGEPFAASGHYYRMGELEAPRGRNLRFYGTDRTSITVNADRSITVADSAVTSSSGGPSTFTIPFRDFNVRSFRSNAVLRWEYRPGSTLYLVWQQNRASEEARGNLVGLGDLFGGLSATGNNFFAVKLSYWIPAL